VPENETKQGISHLVETQSNNRLRSFIGCRITANITAWWWHGLQAQGATSLKKHAVRHNLLMRPPGIPCVEVIMSYFL